jgi:outer membrane protein OmpA-like peptidoglycan-associated protein
MGIVFLCLFVTASAAQMPPAGTMIRNQAESEFDDGSSLQQTLSNPVVNQVLPVYIIGLAPPGTVASPAYTLTGAGGDTLYCAFDLTNSGNGCDSVDVGYARVPPSNTTIASMIFFSDRNGNGRLDPGEDDRSFLAIDPGATIPMDAAVVLPPGGFGGEAFVEVRAWSANDTVPDVQTSVVRITNTDPSQPVLFLGPAGNALALPGGEGSDDDVTRSGFGYSAASCEFENDLLNQGGNPDFFELSLADSLSLPPGLAVSFFDSAGAQLPRSPSPGGGFLVGMVEAGRTIPVRMRVTATAGPLFGVVDGALPIRVLARSVLDTLQHNFTVNELTPPQQFNPDAVISLSQTFHEQTAAVGDVVTLVVTAQNISDSLRVDDCVIAEWPEPQLDFAASPDFVYENGRLVWQAGSLSGGESKTAVVKFVANGRKTSGRSKVTGDVSAVAETGDPVSAGPAVSTILLQNDVFAPEGVVMGEVYVDQNENGRRDPGEPGVRDVAVYIDSGEYAATDSLGRFSLPRVFAGWRTVRLDEQTVPPEMEFFNPPDSLSGGRRDSERLIHMVPGGNAVISFRLRKPPPPVEHVGHEINCQEQVSVTRFARMYRAFTLPSSHFALGKAQLMVGASTQLRPVVEFLFQHPDWSVFLEGHTDSIPINTPEFPSNQELSVARARSVADYLESTGISADRVVIRGYGESRPLATNETIEGRQLNRRVEVSFVPPGVVINEGQLDRVSTALKDLSVLPDTFRVRIHWEITSTSDKPEGAVLALDLPYRFRNADVTVAMDQKLAPSADGRYEIRGLARSKPVRCDIEFRAASSDTAFVHDIVATLEMKRQDNPESPPVAAAVVPGQDPAPASDTAPGYRGPDGNSTAAVIRPPAVTENSNDPRQRTLFRWVETVPVTRDRAQGLAVLTSPSSRRAAAPPPDADPGDNVRFGFLEPRVDEVFSRADQIRVRGRVPVGSRYSISVNGEIQPDKQIGHKAIHVQAGFEEITWYAIRIRPGWNTIVLRAVQMDGSTHTDSVRVALASRPASIEARRKRVLVQADGFSVESLRFEVRDGLGHLVSDGFVGTVVEGDSIIATPDARPAMPGLQVASSAGYLVVDIRPGYDTGRRTVVVECEGMRAYCDVAYVATTRPMLAAGVVDLRFGMYDSGGDGSGEGLENFEDGFAADADARVFLQSSLSHGINLTARLDSEERTEEPHLKQINPDRQYPIYGDESELHFAAPSRTGNYVSVDKGESFLRYGDFRTPFTNGEYLYYHQVATGVTGGLVGGDGAVRAFVTDTDHATFRDEIPADGTSGFYYLEHVPVVLNSERLFLETRDRFQSELLHNLQPLVRNRDYTLNPFDGSILFKEPVAAFDENFHPVYIVAVYQVETDDESQYLMGLRGDLAESRRYNVGATAVANSGDGEAYALYGMDGSLDVGGVRLSGEVARSENDATGNGNAYRVEAAVQNGFTDTKLYYRTMDTGFNNPSYLRGLQELGTRKAGLNSRVFLADDLSLLAEGFVHDLYQVGDDRSTFLAGADFRHRLFQFFAGGRMAGEEIAGEKNTGVLSVLGIGTQLPRRTEFRSRWEKNLGGESASQFPDRLKSRLAVPLSRNLRVTASHEYSTAPGRPGTNQLLAGVESRLSPRTTVYSRYAMDRTAADERMGAIAGLRQAFRLGPGFRATLALEGFQSMTEAEDDEYLSVKTGVATRLADSHVLESRYEYRWQRAYSKHMFQLIANAQMTGGFSLLLNDVVSWTPSDLRETGLNYRGKLGIAYRPIGLPLSTLFSLKNQYYRYAPTGPDDITWKLVLSADANYIPALDHEIRLKYAFKHVEDFSYGISVNTGADLVLGQYIYRFARCWDVDLWGRVLSQRGGTVETGSGIEVGRLFLRSVRVAAGYSAGGFSDPDISGTDAWSRGFGVRVQLILSDWILQEWGALSHNASD